MYVSASAGWEKKGKKYYTNESLLVFIKMQTLSTDFVYGIICNTFLSCWGFFSTTSSSLRGEWQEYYISCQVTRTGKGLILGVLNFLITSTVWKFEIVTCKIHEYFFFDFFFSFVQLELCFCFVIYNEKGIRLMKLLSGIVVCTFVCSFITFYIFCRRSAVLL